MIQCVTTLVTKIDDMSSVPGTHVLEGFPLTSTSTILQI